MTDSLLSEAYALAQQVQQLSSQCASLTWELDRGLPSTGDDGALRRLRTEHDAASRHFDAFVATVAVAQRTAWLSLLTTVGAALATVNASVDVRRAWQAASTGLAPVGFAAAFVEGARLVDENYRLLLKSGALPRGFPRLAAKKK